MVMEMKNTLVPFIFTCIIVVSCNQKSVPSPKLIINGTLAKITDVPYISRIFSIHDIVGLGWNQDCTGTIIHESWILTAAHCFQKTKVQSIKIRVGVHMLNHYGGAHDVDHCICHPEFDQRLNENDVCLLKLSEPLVFSDKIKKAELATSDEGIENVTIAGYGITKTHLSVLYLSMMEMTINNECTGERKYVYPQKICFSSKKIKPDFGDSGAGYISKTDDSSKFIVVGVHARIQLVSDVWLITGARVSHYAQWIQNIMMLCS